MNDDLDVYVLGAGASYVHGAPLTDGILPYAFTTLDEREDRRLKIVHEFLRDVFACKVEDAPEMYPRLVDVLSVADMALDRKESLATGYDYDTLRNVREGLEYAIFRVLEHSMSSRTPRVRRSQATRKLTRTVRDAKTVFVSFNYDVIADIALAHRNHDGNVEEFSLDAIESVEDPGIDYGIEFENVREREFPRECRVPLYKLHGSFNWLLNPGTGDVYYGGLRKAIGVVYEDLQPVYARDRRQSELRPILVTPTHLKDMRNPHLVQLWRKTESALRKAKRITFIGYSFPGDDLHIKYLFKRAIATRQESSTPEIVVVSDQDDSASKPKVQLNYERFFGPNNVRYFGCGFDDWVEEHHHPLVE